jgi:formylglycine-generating enzyme required for sulfatase activity
MLREQRRGCNRTPDSQLPSGMIALRIGLLVASIALAANAAEMPPAVSAALDSARANEWDKVWPLLRQQTDNERRTWLIHTLPQVVDVAPIVRRLTVETDVSVRRALILTLGGFPSEKMPDNQRRELLPLLLRWYRDDPDPGIHSAIDWLLQATGDSTKLHGFAREHAATLAMIDRELIGARTDARLWYVTRERHTMIILEGPVEFMMGAPPAEVGRKPASDSPEEPQHKVQIPRRFSLASREVTVAQFAAFLAANPRVKECFAYPDKPDRMAEVLARFSPDSECPQIAVTWYEAAAYCNWLSQRDGLPESEWVYPRDLESGMKLPANDLHRTGYRLPTEAEWEFAARAGTTSSRFFGSSETWLAEYACYSKYPPKRKMDPIDPRDPARTSLGARLKPNDFGFFDIYGNVWEWCQNRMIESGGPDVDKEDPVLVVSDDVARTRRGGAFPYGAEFMRSANRDTRNAFPQLRRDNVGFRVARTLR